MDAIDNSNSALVRSRYKRGMASTRDRLRELMAEHEHDQAHLAGEIGVSQGAISLIVLGKTQNSRYLPDIADYYGVSLRWLKGHDVPKHDEARPPIERPQTVRLEVLLPSERSLARMFEAFLEIVEAFPDRPDTEMTARLFAQWLPIGLSQLRDLLPDARPVTVSPEIRRELAEALATDDRGPRR